MRACLDQVVWAGDVAVAAVSGVRAAPLASRCGASFVASKEPLAILVVAGKVIAGFTPTGAPLSEDEVMSRYPEACAHLLEVVAREGVGGKRR